MATEFKGFDQKSKKITDEPKITQEVRVFKLDGGGAPEVSKFTFSEIKTRGQGEYSETKRKFGALAATDQDRRSHSGRDSRFQVNPVLRDMLAIEEEEKRLIEEKVRTRVSAAAEEARVNAFDVGYGEGLTKGHAEAFRKFQDEGTAKLQKFETFITECESAKRDIFRANERFLIELIYRISKMVLLKELAMDKEYILRLARELIERVGVRENITLRLHPDDLATAGQLKEGLEKSLGALSNLSVEVSTQVGQGGCLIETEWNAIDATIDTQLRGLYETLIGGKATDVGGDGKGAVGN